MLNILHKLIFEMSYAKSAPVKEIYILINISKSPDLFLTAFK